MRVGDRTDFNRLRMFIETDGTITAHQALEKSIEIMINQLKAIVGFKEEEIEKEVKEDATVKDDTDENSAKAKEIDTEFLKTRIETLNLSARNINALTAANIRTVGVLRERKKRIFWRLKDLVRKAFKR